MKRHIINFILAGAALISASCSQKETELEISLSVKFDPDIFPRNFVICNIGTDLMREKHESLSAFNLVSFGDAFGIVRIERAGSGEAEVEKIMVPGSRAERMGRVALFPSELIQPKIDKIFTWKNRKNNLAHKQPFLLSLYITNFTGRMPAFQGILSHAIYQNATSF